MKKMLFVSNALEPAGDAPDFAIAVAAAEKAGLTAMFIINTTSWAPTGLNMVAGEIYVEEIAPGADRRLEWKRKADAHVAAFSRKCHEAGVASTVTVKEGDAMDIVIRESRFSDLLIIDPLLTFASDDNIPTAFVKDLLHHTECPVLLTGDAHRPIDEVVIAYDGSARAVAAAKEFMNQLPAHGSKRITVLHADDGGGSEARENHDAFLSWLSGYSAHATYLSVEGDARDVLFSHFMDDTDNWQKVLVAGAFGRSALSQFFRPGAAELVVRATATPVFIARH